jgi:hypothetical protein
VPKLFLPFGRLVRKVEADWNIQHDDDAAGQSRQLTATALTRQISSIRSPPQNRFAWLHLEPKPTPYILSDDRPTAILRARIRFNRHHFNARQSRLGLSDTADCSVCHVPETDSHVLFHCARFDRARHDCVAALSRHNIPLSLNLVCGDFFDISPDALADAQNATAQFLRVINSCRPI